jgi:hypothetical protein
MHNPIGASIKNCRILGTGSEGFKFTNRRHEGGPAPAKARIHLKGCEIRDWRQEWAWRGGAAIVVQGAQCDVLVEDTIMVSNVGVGPCLMIDDGGDDRPLDGRTPNGWVIVRRCGIAAEVYTQNYPPMVRIGQLIMGDDRPVVTGALFKNCGIYGEKSSMQFGPGAVPEGRLRVTVCNTKLIQSAAEARWVPTRYGEAKIPLHDRLKNVSEGHEA